MCRILILINSGSIKKDQRSPSLPAGLWQLSLCPSFLVDFPEQSNLPEWEDHVQVVWKGTE